MLPEVLTEAGEYESVTVDALRTDADLDVTKCSRLKELIQHCKRVTPQTLVFK